MRQQIVGWNKTLRALGYRVNWKSYWSQIAAKSRSKNRRQQNGLNTEFSFLKLEPRKVLTTTTGFANVELSGSENELIETEVVFSGVVDDAAYQLQIDQGDGCLLYTSPSPRDRQKSRMPSSA